MPRVRGYVNEVSSENETGNNTVYNETPSYGEEYNTAEVTPEEPAQETETKKETAKPVVVEKKTEIAGSVEQIVRHEKDLSPKYSRAEDAIASILNDGDYYEDYLRSEKADLLKSKEFVLTAIAQNNNRFYAPQTPKPSDWLDEEYLTARIGYFFTETKEGIKPEENTELAENLYNYLRKNSFTSESYATISWILKRVAKVNAAKVTSHEEGERLKDSLGRFNIAVDSALKTAKEKYTATVNAERQRAEKLAEGKKELNDIIDAMKFDF